MTPNMKIQIYHYIIKELEDELSHLKIYTQDFIGLTDRAIGLCDNVMIKLRESIFKEGFSNHDEELNHFKQIKPGVCSKFIFYTEVFHFEANRPENGNKISTDKNRIFLQHLAFVDI